MPYKLASLLLSSEQKSSSVAKIAWAEADHGDPTNEARFARVGKIFSLVEVYATNAKAMLLLDFFSERPKLNYYQQPDLDKNEYPGLDDLEKFFTAAIQQTNHDLAAFLDEHKINYLQPEVSATIGLLSEKGLFLASIGRNQAWILAPEQPSNKQVVKIIVPPEEGYDRANRLFQEIFSGSLSGQGYCLVSNEALAEYIEPTTALNLLANKAPLIGAEKLRNFLQQTNRRVDFLGLIIKRCHFNEQNEEQCLEAPANFISSTHSTTQTQLINNNLRLTEEKTEKILNPSGWSRLINLLKKIAVILINQLFKLVRRNWSNDYRRLTEFSQTKWQATRHDIKSWSGWPIINRGFGRLSLIGRAGWYKAQPKLRQINNYCLAGWLKSAPKRCKLIEKYWLPIRRPLKPILDRLIIIWQKIIYLFRKKYRPIIGYRRGLSKRSRLFLILVGVCLILLSGGIVWQRYRQINQAKLQEQIDFIALVEQKHNQIEANLLYNNFDSANQSLDEAADLIDQRQQSDYRLPEQINDRWQAAILKQEDLMGKVRQIYTLRDGQLLTGQPVNATTSVASLLKLNGQLLAWVDSVNRQVVYQNSRQEWQAVNWPDDWSEITVMASDNQDWYFASNDGRIISLSRDGQWTNWPMDKAIDQIKALAFYSGRIYLVAGDNQIYRYQKQASSFDGGQQWNTDKLPAGEIAGLFVDGQVYVFYQDGQAFKLTNGRQQKIIIKTIEPQIKNWQNCQLLNEQGFYCLEDTGSRIINYSFDGTVISQYLLFDQLSQSVVIDQKGLAIYSLNNQGVYQLTFPTVYNN